MARLLAALFLMALTAGSAGARQDARLLPMEQNPAGHFVIEADLGRPLVFGRGAPQARIPLVVDTGASHTAIEERLAAQLGFRRLGEEETTGDGLTGIFKTQRFVIDALDFGAGPRRVEAVVLFTGDNQAVRAGGLLGNDAFRARRVRLDFANALIELDPHARPDGDLRLDRRTNLILGKARIANIDQPVNVMIDTGATHSLINFPLASANARRRIQSAYIIGGVGGTERRRRGRRTFLGGLELGALCLPAFSIDTADVHGFAARGWAGEPAIILGMDVLRQSEILIDRETGAVDLRGTGDYRCDSRAS